MCQKYVFPYYFSFQKKPFSADFHAFLKIVWKTADFGTIFKIIPKTVIFGGIFKMIPKTAAFGRYYFKKYGKIGRKWLLSVRKIVQKDVLLARE